MVNGDEKLKIGFAVVLILIAIIIAVGIRIVSTPPYISDQPFIPYVAADSSLKTFTSWNDVQLFLDSSLNHGRSVRGIAEVAIASASDAITLPPTTPSQKTDFSTTNIQVEGVDEDDVLKNDGKYLYTVTNGKISILEAYPAAEMKLLSTINDSSTTFNSIFIAGDKLVAFGYDDFNWVPIVLAEERKFETASATVGVRAATIPSQMAVRPEIYPYPYIKGGSVVKIYDVLDRSNPQLLKSLNYKGNYVSSRLIGSKVYLITAEPVYYGLPRPLYAIDGVMREIQPREISYFDYPFDSYQFTTILGIDLNDLQKEEQRKVVLMGGSENIFVSLDNAYITFTRYNYFQPVWPAYEKIVLPQMSAEYKEQIEAINSAEMPDWRKENLKVQVAQNFLLSLNNSQLQQGLYQRIYREQEILVRNYSPTETTSIHKFSLSPAIEYRGKGEVPGHVLNQFSMDEKDNFLRIATTTGQLSRNPAQPSTTNALYTVDENMQIVGRLEGLAPGESIYSARFLGNRAYLVTFKKVDPLFVIDLQDPRNPQLLGKLKIPGYSDYLHPYDENHLIGLGKDAVPAEEGDFAWYQGVKLSLFDVSNVSNPVELANYKIGDRGTDSAALHDHHAFLFSKTKNLLVLPITLAEIDENRYPQGAEPNIYGEFTFQGAYIFNVSLEGFGLRGRISHASQEDLNKLGDYYYGYGADVQRSAFINEALYTLSNKLVKVNNLQTLEEIKSVELPAQELYPYPEPIPLGG